MLRASVEHWAAQCQVALWRGSVRELVEQGEASAIDVDLEYGAAIGRAPGKRQTIQRRATERQAALGVGAARAASKAVEHREIGAIEVHAVDGANPIGAAGGCVSVNFRVG